MVQFLRDLFLRDDQINYLGNDFWVSPALSNVVDSIVQHFSEGKTIWLQFEFILVSYSVCMYPKLRCAFSSFLHLV